MLSQLEYVGCRKILKAVPYDRVDLPVLQHIAEEAQHALQLKALVQDRFPHATWGDRPLSVIGWRYFQSLDQVVSRLEGVRGLNYPAVSWIVEQRVLQVYPEYLAATKNEEVRRVLTRVIAQERRHGGLFDRVSYPDGLRERMLRIETELWNGFVRDAHTYLASGDAPAWLLADEARGQYCELRATD